MVKNPRCQSKLRYIALENILRDHINSHAET